MRGDPDLLAWSRLRYKLGPSSNSASLCLYEERLCVYSLCIHSLNPVTNLMRNIASPAQSTSLAL